TIPTRTSEGGHRIRAEGLRHNRSSLGALPPPTASITLTEQRFSLPGGPPMERPIAYDKLAREDRFVRMRSRDTAALKVEQGLPPFPDLASRPSMRERVHGILVGELQAMEGAGRTVYDFPDAPWEFTMDMARQVWDESRHVEIYLGLLEHLGGYVGEFPESTILWRCACAEDAAARVAGAHRGLEGLGGARL